MWVYVLRCIHLFVFLAYNASGWESMHVCQRVYVCVELTINMCVLIFV